MEERYLKVRRDSFNHDKLASLEVTVICNYVPPSERVTGIECRATSVAKKPAE